MNKTFKCLVSVLTGIIVFVTSAFAQVTTSSMNGKITDASGEVIVGAAVIAVHTPSGTQYHAITNNDGRYFINGMRAGGPYSIEVSCLGYQKVTYTDVMLQLADAYPLNVKLSDDTQTLDEAVVISTASTKFVTEKSGASTNISNRQIVDLPSISRSITDVAKLSPYGGNGMSFAGSDGRTANFTVDGANFNNNFGLSDKLPGGGSPISIDAIDEVQVVISPYDVRQANFIGGGVNAITKSGTNQFKASVYGYYRNENMRGNMAAGTEVAGARDMNRSKTFGGTFGGPIIKNKLFFFANFEYTKTPTVANRWRASENGVANADAYISRTKVSDLQKVQDVLLEKYGYNTGSFSQFPANESNIKALARIDWNINDDHKLAVRYNYTINKSWLSPNGSSSDATTRTTANRFSQYGMSYANSMYSMDNKVHTWSVDLNSRISDDMSNQLLATFSILDDIRGTNSSKFPFIDILDGEAYQEGLFLPYISAGYELFTWNNAVHNRVFNIKDDFNYYLGNHKITVGANYEFNLADNAYMRNGTGYYRYKSLDDFLEQKAPETVCMTYGYSNTADPENPAARVRYHKASVYAQDEFNPTERLKLTAGLRLEAIFFSNKDLMRNAAIWNINNPEGDPIKDASGNVIAQGSPEIYNGYRIDTGKWPTTSIQVSPRVGFVYDILGDNSLKLRGGTGLFTGRLPLVFFTNMPTNSGMVQYQCKIQTDAKGVADDNLAKLDGPILSTDALKDKLINELGYPSEVKPEDGTLPSSIAAVDRKFKMPQVWKTSLALDYAFPTPFPMSISVEGIFNKTVNQVCIQDYNIKSPAGFAKFNGPDDRYIYPADFKYTYFDAAKNKTVTAPSAYVLTNTNKGYGWNASAVFKIAPFKGLDITASYAHTAQKELTGMPGSDASSAFTYIPTVNGPNNPKLHSSSYVEPDRMFINATYHDPGNNSWNLFFEGWRGGYNYTYMLSNDMNGDGYNYDVIYIPSDRSQMKFVSEDDAARFWAYVDNDKYLSKVKDNYTEAYSVYSPWNWRLDFRWTHDFKLKIGQSTNTLQLSLDINNVLNVFNNKWGVARYMNSKLDSGRILKYEKMDDQGYPVYSTPDAVNGNIDTWVFNKSIGQCWYAQIGLKYMFN